MASDLETLQGTWHLASSEVDGTVLGPELISGASIVVTGDRFVSLGMGAPYEGTFVVDEKAKPKALDMLITGGHASGTQHAGVYKIADGTWTMCLAPAGAPRPRAFSCGPAGGFALQTFRRTPPRAGPTTSAAAAPSVSPFAAAAEASPFEGEWAMVSGVFNGATMAPDMVKWCKRVTTGDITKVLAGPNVMLEARFTLDLATTPWTIDYVNLGGADKGRSQLGIAELQDDVLRVCMSPPGRPRPAEFESRKGDKRSFTTWRRPTRTT
jgi:uncharacterized protein (TIGR03067 family)